MSALQFPFLPSGPLPAGRLKKIALEWLAWVAIAAVAYSQTGYFDVTIADYPLGATGWPRVICAMIVVGATGQALYQIYGATPSEEEEAPAAAPRRWDLNLVLQVFGIFLLPFIYLYLMPEIGFYVATPVFIVLFLLLLNVRSLPVVVGVTAVVYGVILLIFTRLFFVALPVGYLDGFYEANIAVIDFVRLGM